MWLLLCNPVHSQQHNEQNVEVWKIKTYKVHVLPNTVSKSQCKLLHVSHNNDNSRNKNMTMKNVYIYK